MKIRRQKKSQKILAFFQSNFALQAPYTVLLDATFCRAALEGKVLIKEQIPKYLGAQTKIVTTQCIILEVEKLSKISSKLYGTWIVVKQFPVHKCGHEGDPVPASFCAKSLLGKNNPGKYIMASQDPELRSHVHQEVVGTPILYLHQSAPTLEKPTKKVYKLSSHEETTLKTLKRKHFGETIQEPPRKKKKAKNPHSLSCKKSKKVKQANQQKTDGKRKRKRHKRKGGAAKDMSRSE
ncbi:rRNA-processing protein UTP23 homolog [Portunus trituberculatus]|uniref:rRNA-processing protein UTP23 homolog n=1 Tax=Portunus trituberculatus TaxID=210409 RepID=UPI001E1CE061|nr:rRNA-processing protein UTP23 homolog [Portunus trituberculatus]